MTGVAGAYFGSKGTHAVSSAASMLVFAAVALVAGLPMFRGGAVAVLPRVLSWASDSLEARVAVGTSLAIIALNSAAGLVGQIRHAELDWRLTAAFTGMTLVGKLVGLSAGERFSEAALRKAFASVPVVVA